MNRERLVERLRGQLEWAGWPRLVVFLLVTAAGAMGFVVSFALLSAGYDSMALRYGVAGLSGYFTFLLLLGAYVAWQRRFAYDRSTALDGVDMFDVGGGIGRGLVDAADCGAKAFSGGRSGGGGAADSWGVPRSDAAGGNWFDADLDIGWVVIALAAALAGLFAVGYVVWAAPVLLAEVLVDAVIVGAVSRKMTADGPRDWTATAVRRTWFPAAVLIATLIAAGWGLQGAVPEAKSIGPAVRTLLGR